MLTLKEVSKRIEREVSTLHRWGVNGVAIPIYKTNGLKTICKKDLEAFQTRHKWKKLDPVFFKVQAFKDGACVWCGKRRGNIEQVKDGLKIYPSLKNCKLFFEQI